MPQILTTNALILCPHGGKGTTIPTSTKWTINGGFVSLENDTGVLACPFIPLPCGGYQLKSMSLNATQVDGRKVILATDFNQTFTGLPLLMTEFHQTFDESTPAPIPSGQAAPPPSPDMADLAPPLVAPPVQAFPFSISAPAPVVAVFNLTSNHPLMWVLTLINEPLKYNLDLTNGSPAGAAVVPPGGQWTTPSLTVTVTMTPSFLTALTAGAHHIFMTAVSRRGLSGYGQATITVSP